MQLLVVARGLVIIKKSVIIFHPPYRVWACIKFVASFLSGHRYLGSSVSDCREILRDDRAVSIFVLRNKHDDTP